MDQVLSKTTISSYLSLFALCLFLIISPANSFSLCECIQYSHLSVSERERENMVKERERVSLTMKGCMCYSEREREREREREFNGMTVCDSENEWMYLVHVSERDRELVSLKCGLFTAFIRLDVDYARRLVSLHRWTRMRWRDAPHRMFHNS